MSLKDLVIEKRTVATDGGSFEVQGLSIEALASLLDQHKEELSALFSESVKFDVLVRDFPVFVAKLIAVAAGEPKEINQVRSLPAGVQLDALMAIWDMTGIDVGQVGNLLGGALENLNLVHRALPEITSEPG